MFAVGTAILIAAAWPSALAAQATASREVVQPLPSQQVRRLNRALMELARRPDRLEALLEAADASLAVADYDAAIGFFGRAANVAPTDPRVKLGTARTYLRAGRPVAALPLFAAAQSAGASARDVLPSQALALDMVGDQPGAQAAYTRALELDPDNHEVRRRLALSHAISGDADAFQDALAPLLEERDFAAFRARAFGLAILGQSERAASIVEAVMPADLAARIVPYLAFMPRLTPAQQAAAANLGIFPRAADIGRESPLIARFAGENAVGSNLEPAGEPLGTPAGGTLRETAAPNVPPAQLRSAASGDIASPENPAALPDIRTVEVGARPGGAAVDAKPANVDNAFADLAASQTGGTLIVDDAVDLRAIRVARDASPTTTANGSATAKPARRFWVQVATGQDVEALGFDWRRLSRRVPELLARFEPHVTPWGQANRLLAGPLESEAAVRALINELAARGIDTFAYTSPEDAEIQRLE